MTAICPSCQAPQDQGLLCANCTLRLEHELGDVPAIVAELDVTISKQARIGGGGKAGIGGAHEKNPVNLGALQAADNLANTLSTWARDVCGDAALWVTDGRPVSIVASHALLCEIPAIRKHPAADELVDEIADSVTQARRAVDRPADRVFVGPCLTEFEGVTCYEDLYARPKTGQVRCKVCGAEHDVEERQEWLLNEARDRLFTVQEAAQIIGSYGHLQITESTIRGYISGGHLGYHGKVGGSSVIRLGDLMVAIAKHAARASGRKLRRVV